MQQIRKGAFETNSSSTHSITICNDEKFLKFDQLHPNVEGIINIYPGEFGWEYCKHYDAPTKASYALTYAKGHIRYDYTDYKNPIITETKKADQLCQQLRDVIQKATGCSNVEFVPDSENFWGYIDHQSFEVCEEAFVSDKSLRDFIFNTHSMLVTDNDNH